MAPKRAFRQLKSEDHEKFVSSILGPPAVLQTERNAVTWGRT